MTAIRGFMAAGLGGYIADWSGGVGSSARRRGQPRDGLELRLVPVLLGDAFRRSGTSRSPRGLTLTGVGRLPEGLVILDYRLCAASRLALGELEGAAGLALAVLLAL